MEKAIYPGLAFLALLFVGWLIDRWSKHKNTNAVSTVEDIIKGRIQLAIGEVGFHWKRYLAMRPPFLRDEPLSQTVTCFAAAAFEAIVSGQPDLWMIVFAGIRLSESHTPAALDAAITEVSRRYGIGAGPDAKPPPTLPS